VFQVLVLEFDGSGGLHPGLAFVDEELDGSEVDVVAVY
jgi:hypothetical protein